jgi:carbamoyl-phosphate synthase large subunit
LSSANARKFNILFTSAGRRVELLRAFRKAYDSLGLTGKIIALDVDPLAPALQVADGPYLVPRLDDPGFIPALIGICRSQQVNLVVPLIDWDIPVLAEWREEIEKTGARVAVVSKQAASLTSDKWETFEFFSRLGIPTPQSWLPEHLDPNKTDYPLFIKPRFGSAAHHTFRIRDARELAFFLEYVPRPIVQEFIAGPEITNDVVCHLDGEVLAVVSRRRIEVRWGEVAKGVTLLDAEIIEKCVLVARELPAVGPITVQCILKDGRAVFTEINSRLGGGAPLSIQAGVDFPRLMLARAAGILVDIPPLGAYRSGLFLTRYDDSFVLTQDDYERMESCRFRSG